MHTKRLGLFAANVACAVARTIPLRGPLPFNYTTLATASNRTDSTNSTLAALVTDGISSCGSAWMAIPDVTIGSNTDSRTGFTTAANKFCSMANGLTVASQGYLSMATEVFLDGGGNPPAYGLLGYLYFEIHNKQSTAHVVNKASCQTYLNTLSDTGGQCYGSDHGDTKGGTYQVGAEAISYHALGFGTPPTQDALNKLYTSGALAAQTPNKGSGAPLSPWPLDSLNSVKPTSCHSHNDYDHDIPLFQALAAGCIGVEADVWLVSGNLYIGHLLPTLGRTLTAQYINPLKAIIDHNGGSVYKAQPSRTLSLLVDFKTSDTGTLDAVVTALDPLRQAGYLSRIQNGQFVRGAVTVVASGSYPASRIMSGDGVPNFDIFCDAPLAGLANSNYTAQNSYYASADFQDVVGDPSSATLTTAEINTITTQVGQAHERGLVVRYWNLPGDYVWEPLEQLDADLLNADDLYDTARIPRLSA
ncbi:hypothetical protein GGR57DRAFT_510242 [Xylariaceae sp. FL1272]|nr:hypothetical protein GGR57DRAFT_510242 [Xylariaceae sp. FL1272]